MAYNIVGNGYNYLGVTAVTPPNLQINPNAPTINNMNAKIGDFWLQQDTTNLWFLTSLANQQAIWTPVGGGGGDVNTIEGDTGGPVTATGGNIEVAGGININTEGSGSTLTINLNDSIYLPDTNSVGTEGTYYLGGVSFLHAYGTGNTFLGRRAGNFSLTGDNNVYIGTEAANNAGSASKNVVIGSGSAESMVSSGGNVLIGYVSGQNVIGGGHNVAIGAYSLKSATIDSECVAIGFESLALNNAGEQNVAIGNLSGANLEIGSYNTLVGTASGYNYLSNESSNVIIGNLGEIDDQNVLRIGIDGNGIGQQDEAYIAGIYNRSVDAGTQQTVVIDSDGKLGSVVGGAGDITDVNSGDNITVNTVGTVATVNLNKSILQPITNAAGTEGLYSLGGDRFLHNYGTNNTFVGTNAGNLTLVGGGSDNVAVGNLAGNAISSGFNNVFIGPESGSSNTSGETNIFVGLQSGLLNTSGAGNIAIGILALSGAATSQNNLILGNASGTNYTGSESDNILISSEGVLGDNNVLRIGDSGTGDYQVDSAYIAGTYARTVDGGSQQFVVIDSVGKLGSVIGGGGGGDVNTLTGDTGPAVTSTGNNIDVNGGLNINTSGAASTLTINLDDSISLPNTNGSGTEGLYSLGGSRFLHNYGTDNVFLGREAGNLSLSGNNSVAVGANSLKAITNSSECVAVGYGSLMTNFGGNQNVAIGYLSGSNIESGSYNALVGTGSGFNYISNESSNIIISNLGEIDDQNVIRIGTDGTGIGQQNEAYIAGTYNRSVDAGTQQMVIIDSTGKLGSVVGGALPVVDGCISWTGKGVDGATPPIFYQCAIAATTVATASKTIFTLPAVSYKMFTAQVVAGGFETGATRRVHKSAAWSSNGSSYEVTANTAGGSAITIDYTDCTIDVKGPTGSVGTRYWNAQIQLCFTQV